jgi:hypothetical protein
MLRTVWLSVCSILFWLLRNHYVVIMEHVTVAELLSS